MIRYTPITLLRDARALAPFVLLALILHAALLFIAPPPHRKPPMISAVLEIYIQPQRTLKPPISPHPGTDDSKDVFTSVKAPKPREKPPGRTESMHFVQVPLNQSEPARAADLQDPRKVTETGEGGGNQTTARMNGTQALLNSAYQIAREAGRGHQEAKERSPALSERPALPELARLLAVNHVISGVTEYADGVIKVVTESGNAYCMQTRSNLPQDGPVKPESIPMTCP